MDDHRTSIKPKKIKLTDSRIMINFLYPLELGFLINIFSDAGYSVPMESLKQGLSNRNINNITLIDQEEFILVYNITKKMLEIGSNRSNVVSAFKQILSTIQNSQYDYLKNIQYLEGIITIPKFSSKKISEVFQKIDIEPIRSLNNLFNNEAWKVHGIRLTSNYNAVTFNWDAIRISPAHAFGSDNYVIEAVIRRDNFEQFQSEIENITKHLDNIIMRDNQ